MKMLIAGKWIDKDKKIEVRNPYNGELIDTVPQADKDDVGKAIQSAVKGFEAMRNLSGYKRAEILAGVAGLLRKRFDGFVRSVAQEVGKTVKEAKGEVNRAIQTFIVASEEAKRIQGETIPFDAAPGGENKTGFYLRVPAGVILAITPFNFPLNLACHKLAPALASGNSVILKPASATPLTDLKLGELILEAGLPEDALNIITGSGEEIGDLLVSDPRIRMVTFTGSLAVGKRLTQKAGLKKIALELGSNSAVIIMQDADLDSAIPRLLTGAYAVAGQVCISVQRLMVHEAVYETFLDRFIPLVEKLKAGDQLDENVDMGPMISEKEAERVENWVKEAMAEGAKCLPGIKRQGSLLYPMVLTGIKPEMKVFSEEAFGPLVTVNSFKTFPEAIDLVNRSQYGLQAGIYTRNINTALEAAKKIEAGGVIVNDVPTFRVDLMPYGGVKGSGLGREGVKYAVEEMTEIKLVCFSL